MAEYESALETNLITGLSSMSPVGRRELMGAVVKSRMDEVNRETWRFRFGGSEIQVKDLARPVLAIINRVNEYINAATSANPFASAAWTGVSFAFASKYSTSSLVPSHKGN